MNDLKNPFQIHAYRAAIVEMKELLAVCPRSDIAMALYAYRHAINGTPILVGIKECFELNDPIRDYRLIVKTIDIVLSAFPRNAWIRMLRARSLWAVEHYACALEDLLYAWKLEPKNVLTLAMIGETYVQMERYNNAMSVFERANEIDPHLPRIYLSRGLAYSFWARSSTCSKEKKAYYEFALIDLSCAFHLLPDKQLLIRNATNRILHALKDL